MDELNFEDFYVFGAGAIAYKCKTILENDGKKVISFFTSQVSFREIENVPVISLTALNQNFNFNCPVIIGVFNREPNAFLLEIINKLKSLGFTKIITFPEFHALYSVQFGDIFWLTNKQFYRKNIEQFNYILSILNDEQSKSAYLQIIDYLLTFDPKILCKPDFEHQYFPADLVVWNGVGAFYDIGSFDGENIIDAYKTIGKLDEVIAFEPDLNNFQKIVLNEKIKQICNRYYFYPCGVWSKTMHLKFESGNGESSSQSETGDQLIPVIKIDDISNTKVGFIKMDIEGAEIEALLGAKETIMKFKPSLAISLYHKPSHFYAIPKLIQNWDLGYKFYIRLHGNNLFETVLYCLQ